MSAQDLPIIWSSLHQAYTTDVNLINPAWIALEEAYNSKERHYHNLRHIASLISLQQEYAGNITDNDTVLFSIFFHDLVYNVPGSDNEALSAAAAATHLHAIGYPAERTRLVETFINATRTHVNELQHPDLDHFLDFDLQILGASPETYQAYTKQIRQEFSLYPDLVYRPGRKKVLQHFLDTPAIFRTPAFGERYEQQARENLITELNTL
jgi:predicted metal-dependent HD superfamily phosphohydrolase